MIVSNDLCVCGHNRSAHSHYRAGTECSGCMGVWCKRYRKERFYHRLARKVLGKK